MAQKSKASVRGSELMAQCWGLVRTSVCDSRLLSPLQSRSSQFYLLLITPLSPSQAVESSVSIVWEVFHWELGGRVPGEGGGCLHLLGTLGGVHL